MILERYLVLLAVILWAGAVAAPEEKADIAATTLVICGAILGVAMSAWLFF